MIKRGLLDKKVMETELTKTIKRKIIKDFPNIMPSKLRTSRWATEVWTPTGICDVVKAEDYVEKIENTCEYKTVKKNRCVPDLF